PPKPKPLEMPVKVSLKSEPETKPLQIQQHKHIPGMTGFIEDLAVVKEQIKELLDKGQSQDEIIKNLLTVGFDEDVIIAAFKELKQQKQI
ncbi:MAG: hypothetical protein DRP18_04630, partial [Candidatus Aenigmatarchaeota archaeon]